MRFFKGTGIMSRWWGILLGLCIMPAFALQNELAIYAGEPTPVPARIMLLIDTSGSMNNPLNSNCGQATCPTKLQVLRCTLLQFIDYEDSYFEANCGDVVEDGVVTRWPDSFQVGLARFTATEPEDTFASAVVKADIRPLNYVYSDHTTHRQLLHDIVVAEDSRDVVGIEATGPTPLMTSYLETLEFLTGGRAVSGASACDDQEDGSNCSVSSVWLDGVVGNYKRGMDTSLICGINNNHLVVLTDGRSTEESAGRFIYQSNGAITISRRINQIISGDDSVGELTDCAGSTPRGEFDNNFSWGCVNPLAEWLADKDDNGEVQGIKTHTIAYSLGEYSEGEDPSCTIPREIDGESTAPDYLCNWALKGGGKSFAANDEAGLQNAFQSISEDALMRESFTAAVPGVGVNQSNRFTYIDDVYYSVFKPSDSSFWYGNLKKYKLAMLDDGPAIVGQGNAPIDSDADGFVDSDVRSFWTASPVVDGDNVLLGGAASEIPSVAARRLFTYLDGTETQITDDSVSAVVEEMLPESANETEEASESQETTDLRNRYSGVLDWLRGTDAGGVEWERLTEEANKTHRQLYGAPIHSSPVVVNYTSTQEVDGVRVALTEPEDQSNLVFVSTNDGKLYGVDAQTGAEKLAFVPGEFLQPASNGSEPHIANLYDAARGGLTGPVLYGLDATWSVWRQDVNRDGNITSDVNSGDWVYLYGGMRRGGHNYYGLDMTAANSSPADMDQLFVLKGGEPGSEFENMGQTWSEPVLGMIEYNGKSVVVMIVAGGYDPVYDEVDSVTGAPIRPTVASVKGAQLYIVAAHTRGPNDIQAGEVLWWASSSSNSMPGNHYRIAELEDSIPSTVKVLDKDGDGYLDHIYVGDLGGRIHRIDINKENTGYGTLATSAVVAQLGMRGNGTASAPVDDRRFYFPPSIALMKDNLGRKYVSLAIGSGLLTSPRDTTVNEKFYFIRDYAAFGTTVSAADNPPYEYVLGRNAEKLLGSPLIVGGQAYFSTYYWGDNAVAASDDNQCRAQYGRAALYRYVPNTNQTIESLYAQPQTLAGSLATIMREIEGVTNDEGELIQPPGSDFIGIGGTSAFDLPDVDLGNIRKTRWKQCPTDGVCE